MDVAGLDTNLDPEPAAIGADAPLAGINVVEVTMYVQGPVCGLTLASLGADVIKLEQVGTADFMRSFQGAFGVVFDERGQDWMYASLNRNKRAMSLDVMDPAGREVLEALIGEADVFVTNLRASGLARMGLDAETLMAMNPRLVYCRGGGFAIEGDLAEAPCQDTVGMAFGGFMDVTSQGDAPNYPPGSMSDILTGTNMAAGVMAGLVKRSTTGRGCVVETSQTQALLWLQLQSVGIAANLGERVEPFRHDQTTNPLFTVYEAADGWVAVAVLLPPQWPALARIMDLEDQLEDPRFCDFWKVLEHGDELRPALAERFTTRTVGEWVTAMRDADLWVAPVNRLGDLAADPDIRANDYLVDFDDGFIGPPAPFFVDDHRGRRGATAEYGQDTDQILADLGYDEDRVLELRANGAIW